MSYEDREIEIEYEPIQANGNSDPSNPLHVIEYNMWILGKAFEWVRGLDTDGILDNGQELKSMIKSSFKQIREMQSVISSLNNEKPSK